MPLFTFKCPKCDFTIEKFLHRLADDTEILCEKCDGKCERQFSQSKTNTVLDAKDMLSQQIIPDAKRMMDNVKKGKDSDFVDIYGDN